MSIFAPVPARKKFITRIKDEIQRAKKRSAVFSLVIIRLVRLREVNQEYGYDFADRLLAHVDEVIRSSVRKNDYVEKIGDKEYGVILSDTRGLGDSVLFANQVIAWFDKPFKIDEISIRARVRIGIAQFPEHALDHVELLKLADMAAYRARHYAEGFAIAPSEDDDDTTTMYALESELEKAIEQKQIEYYFQPKVSLVSGGITGFEILSRWDSRKWGMVPPDQFIDTAEKYGLVTSLTIDCLTRSLNRFAELVDNNRGEDFTLSVNLSARILNDQDSIERVLNTVNIWCNRPESLILEITEGAIMTQPEVTREMLEQLNKTGIRVSIDDFGTGYSSLSYLTRIPVDELKIDKSFVMNLPGSEDNEKIIRSIIDLAKNFNMTTVAEGVEDQETFARLKDMGCDLAQGYLISQALPFDQLQPWIDGWKKNL